MTRPKDKIMRIFNYILLTVLLPLVLLLTPSALFAIGEFSLGVNAGVTYAPNNIDDTINRYNDTLKYWAAANPGADVEQINVPYAPVLGFNVRYQFNFFLIRFGWHYSTSALSSEGSVTPNGGVKNKIKISSFQHSLPATVGLIMPLKKRTYFYIGAGGTFHMAFVEMTQSNPVQVGFDMGDAYPIGPALSNNKRDRYYKEFVGYHLILGAEVPVTNKFTLTAEWIHQEGRSYPMNNDGEDNAGASTSAPKKAINARGDVLLFGINYYIPI